MRFVFHLVVVLKGTMTNPLIPFAAILLSLSSSYPVNMIKVSIAQKCTLGAQSPDLPWPLDWFWASNVVLANGMIYYLYENDLGYKGVPCFQSFQKNKFFPQFFCPGATWTIKSFKKTLFF